MAISNYKDCFLLIVIFYGCLTQLSTSYNASYSYGLYDYVYPFVDITQNQTDCTIHNNGTCPLYIALMMTYGGEFESSGVIPGVQMALDQINNDPTMLPGYTLHYILKKTKVYITII